MLIKVPVSLVISLFWSKYTASTSHLVEIHHDSNPAHFTRAADKIVQLTTWGYQSDPFSISDTAQFDPVSAKAFHFVNAENHGR